MLSQHKAITSVSEERRERPQRPAARGTQLVVGATKQNGKKNESEGERGEERRVLNGDDEDCDGEGGDKRWSCSGGEVPGGDGSRGGGSIAAARL